MTKKILFSLLCLTASNSALATSYRIVDLGAVPQGETRPTNAISMATAINNAGDVVGVYKNAQGYTRSFLYRNGSAQDIGTIGNYTQVVAYDISDSLQIIGKYANGYSTSSASIEGCLDVIYNKYDNCGGYSFVNYNNTMISLNDNLGISSSSLTPIKINKQGAILWTHGSFYNGNTSYIIYPPYTEIGLGPYSCNGVDLAEDGTTIGGQNDSRHACVVRDNISYDLQTLNNSVFTYLNGNTFYPYSRSWFNKFDTNGDLILKAYKNDSNKIELFKVDNFNTASFTSLLINNDPQYYYYSQISSNNKNQKIGYYYQSDTSSLPCYYTRCAYIEENGGKTRLDTLIPFFSPWVRLSEALDINDNGAIVGYGIIKSNDNILGTTIEEKHAFLLIPDSEGSVGARLVPIIDYLLADD